MEIDAGIVLRDIPVSGTDVSRRRRWRSMTNKQIETLCEEVFLPQIDKLLQRRLDELSETVEIATTEIFKIEDRVEVIAAYLGERDVDADN